MKYAVPPLIRRTVRSRFLGNFVLLFGLLFLLGTSLDTLMTFHRYLRVAPGEDFGRFLNALGLVVDFQLPRLFQLYALLWSPAAVGAAGFTFIRMQRHREIVLLLASGVSSRGLLRPIAEGTLILAALQGLNQEFMVPKLAPVLSRTQGDIGQDAIQAFSVPPTPDGLGRLWCAASCDTTDGLLVEVLILERDDSGRTIRRIEASSARWNGSDSWILEDGYAIDLSELPRPPTPVERMVSNLDPMILLARHRSQFAGLFGWSDIMQTLQRLESSGSELRTVKSQFQRQFSAHFSALFAGLLLPFFTLPPLLNPCPDGLVRAGGKAILLGLGGYVMVWGSMMAAVPGFSPWLAPFLPTLLLCPLAISAFIGTRG